MADNSYTPKDILDRYAKLVLRKDRVFTTKNDKGEEVAQVNSSDAEVYLPRNYKDDIVLAIGPKDAVFLEFDNKQGNDYRKVNRRFVMEAASACNSLGIQYCITEHQGCVSPYLRIYNIKGIPVNYDNVLAKELLIDLIVSEEARKYLDKSNYKWTYSPVIGHEHWKPKYKGAKHEIIDGIHPLNQVNEYPKELLNQIKKSKKTNKATIINLKQSKHRWTEDFLLNYCCNNPLPAGSRNTVIEKNLAILIVHREDRDAIERQYLQVQQQENSRPSSWYSGILKGQYTTVNARELENYIKDYEIPYNISSDEKQTPEDTNIVHRERIADDTTVVLTKEKVYIEKERQKEDYSYDVLKGRFLPKRQLFLDNERVYEIETTRTFRGNAEEIMSFLRREGPIVNRNNANDAINALLQGMKLPTVISHATYGIYLNDKNLELCLEPYTRSEIQQQVEREIKPSITTPITKRQVELWLTLPSFWHHYEIYPIMALTVIAPFGYVLRNKGISVPYVYHFSIESGIGKTESAVIFTEDLFGKKKQSYDSINSSYRLADGLDSYGGLICIDEAEKFPWDKYASHIQQAVESPYQDKRGTPHLGSRDYLSRATLAFTSNHFPIKRKALLVRLIKVEFDLKAKDERKDKKQIEKLVALRKQLEPIGWRLVECEILAINNKIDTLVENIQKHASVFRTKLHRIEDSRRPLDWAVVYEGLKLWERAAKQFNIEWSAPTYDEFIDEVILPNEASTFESLEQPAEDFIGWWQMWKVKNVFRDYITSDDARGKGEVWCEKIIRFNDKNYDGDVVTISILQEYVKEKQSVTTPINNLSTLGKAISALTELPYDIVYKTWRGREFRISKKGTFIPHEKYDIDDFITENLQQIVDLVAKNIDSNKKSIQEILQFFDNFDGVINEVRFYKIAKELVFFIKDLIKENE